MFRIRIRFRVATWLRNRQVTKSFWPEKIVEFSSFQGTFSLWQCKNVLRSLVRIHNETSGWIRIRIKTSGWTGPAIESSGSEILDTPVKEARMDGCVRYRTLLSLTHTVTVQWIACSKSKIFSWFIIHCLELPHKNRKPKERRALNNCCRLCRRASVLPRTGSGMRTRSKTRRVSLGLGKRRRQQQGGVPMGQRAFSLEHTKV